MRDPYIQNMDGAKQKPVNRNVFQTFGLYKNGIRNRPLWDLNDTAALLPVMQGKRVFILGSGPSLDKNFKYFAENYTKDMGPVIACDGAVNDLLAIGFKPDYFICAEADDQDSHPGELTVDLFLDGHSRLNDFTDVPLLASTWTSHLFIKKWPCDKVYFYKNMDIRYEQLHMFRDDLWPPDSPFPSLEIEPRTSTVGFHAIDLCRELHAKEVVLLGFDYKVYGTQHHSKHFNLDDQRDLDRCFKDHVAWFIHFYDGDFGMPVINCTEGGALEHRRIQCEDMTLEELWGEND